jgi:transcriptional regulator with XRE-family HTH domain
MLKEEFLCSTLKTKVVCNEMFGLNFLKARKMKGIDQKDAAAALEVSPAFLSKVENDKQRPSIDLILKAADFYGVKPGYFFEEREEIDLESLKMNKNLRFIKDLETLSDKELKEKYHIEYDNRELSTTELKGIMAYVRSLRSLEE